MPTDFTSLIAFASSKSVADKSVIKYIYVTAVDFPETIHSYKTIEKEIDRLEDAEVEIFTSSVIKLGKEVSLLR